MSSRSGGASSSSTDGSSRAARRSLTVGLLAIVSITAFEALAAATVLPATVAELGGLGWYGGAFSGFMALNVVSIVVSGRLLDRGGALGPFVWGTASFVAGLCIAGVAPAMPVVVLGRMVQGFGAGAISSVAYVAVARGYDESEKPRMLALLSSAWVVPGLIGPAIAAQVAERAGWRVVFIGLAPLAVIAALVAAPGLSRLLAPDPPPSPSRLRDIVSAGAAGGDVRVGHAALGCMALLTWCFFGAEAFVPLTLTSIRHGTLTASGFALTAGTLAWTAGAWIQERLARRGRHRALVRAGFATLGAGVALFAALLAPRAPDFVGVVAWGIAGLGMGVAYSTLSLVVLALPAAGREGAAATALQLANVLGIAAGTGVGGAIVAVALEAGRTESLGVLVCFATAVLAAALGYAVAGRLGNGGPWPPAAR